MTEDVTVDAVDTATQSEGVTPETTDAQTEGSHADSQVDAQTETEVESKEVEETVDQKLERLTKANEAQQRRIDRQTAANRKVQESYAQKLREFEALQEKVKPEPVDAEPSIDDFESYDEFIDAKAEYKAKAKMAELEAARTETQRQEKQRALMQERNTLRESQEAEYIAVNPNYKNSKAEFEGFVQSLDVSPEVEQYIVDQTFDGNIAQVIDYFGSNGGERLGELETISKLSPRKAAIEIYKIQQGMTAPQKKTVKPLSKPVSKIKTSVKGGKSVSNLDEAGLRKWMNS